MTVHVTPYLMMDGNAKEAIQFYEQVLDAKVLTTISYGVTPDITSRDLEGLVSYSKLIIGVSELIVSYSHSTLPVVQGNQVTICISSQDVEKSKRFFDALKQGGIVKMPFQET